MPIPTDSKIDPGPMQAFAEAHGITPAAPAAFPLNALPPEIRDFVTECARVCQVPYELPASCCLAVISAAVGLRLRVRSIHGKTTPATLMIFGAAETGSGKSETFRECVAPFEKCHQQERQRWRDEVLPGAKAEARLLAKEMKNLENKAGKSNVDREQLKRELASAEARKAIADAHLLPPVYRASDFTTPELIRLLCRMDGQIFAASPDAKNFVDMVLGRYNEGGTDEEAYLKGFSLEPIDRNRVLDGSQETQEACIVGLWLTQPDKLARLVAERTLSESGLLPRLLMVPVHCSPFRVNLGEEGIAARARNQYSALIGGLFQSFRAQAKTHIIEADEEAREALAAFHNAIADRREVELRDVTGFAARWGEYAWRLALVVHAAGHGTEAARHSLTLEDAQAGIDLAKWFAAKQLEVLNAGRVSARCDLHDRVLKLFVTSNEIVARDIYRANITPRENTGLAVALLEEMEASGLLTHEDRPTARANHIQRVYRQPTSPKEAERTYGT